MIRRYDNNDYLINFILFGVILLSHFSKWRAFIYLNFNP